MWVKGRKAAKHTAMYVPMQQSCMICTCTPEPKVQLKKKKKIKKILLVISCLNRNGGLSLLLGYIILLILNIFYEVGSHYVVQAGLKHWAQAIFPPQSLLK